MAKVLVLGPPGGGKTTSICPTPMYDIKGLDPKETFIIACTKKELPMVGWKKHYIPIKDVNATSGNYLQTSRADVIAAVITNVSRNRPDIKTIVTDDTNYIMQKRFMNNKTTGYKVFNDIGNDMVMFFNAIDESEKNIVVLMHYEPVQDDYGVTYKAKTVGKMVDAYLTIEGLFSNVIYTKQTFDLATKKVTKQFVTNFDGQFPAKTPPGAFDSIYVKNDMHLVLETLNNYSLGK